MALVVDASIMLAWYFEDENNPPPSLLDKLVREDVVVPSHWQTELANGVVVAERRERIKVAEIGRLFETLEALSIEVDDEGASNALARILPLSRAHGLTAYDTLYLELAERRGLPLATRDSDLADAARAVGVEVLSV
jgi:predicted nucleic acid-binding protein